MNLTDNFIYQNFKVIRDQIVHGVANRKYLIEPKDGFPGCLTDIGMRDSLKKWNVNLGSTPEDSEIYNSIKTFLLLCENEPKDDKRYEGVSQSIKSLLRIVCLNNPTYLSYENYVYHITQSEVIIKFILSLFDLEPEEKIYAFGGNWEKPCQYEGDFRTERGDKTKRGEFLSRQRLIGYICGDALNSLLWCMRTHRNHFSHNSASDYTLKANATKSNRKSELYTYIIDRSISIERLKYLLIDYITVFFFMFRNKRLKGNYQKTHDEKISLEFSIDDKIKDCKLTLTDPENRRCFNIVNNKTYDVTRFSEYRLDIVGNGESKSTNFKIDHTYTSNVRVTISVPPGQLDPFKPDITDLIDISYIPEYQMMKEIWDACAFDSDMAEYIELAKNLTSKCFYTNKNDKIAIGKFKEEISTSIRQLHENIKQDLKPNLSEILSKVNAEIGKHHTKMKEAIKDNLLEDACKQIEGAFSKLNYLKTDGTKNHLTRNEQISEASRRFREDGILDTSNTDNDRFIDEVNYMTILDAILDIGDLNMLYLMKDRLSSIISEKGRTVGLACEFHIKINAEKEKIRSDKGLSFNSGEAQDFKIVFVDQLSRMWNSENFAKFLSLRASYIRSLLGHETSVKEIISDFMKNPGKNEFNESLDSGTAENLRKGLLKLKEGLEAMSPCPIIDAINKSGHHTSWCNHLIETEKKRVLATCFLRDYILLASDNLSEFDHTVLWILWDYLKVYFNILSLRSVKESDSSPNLKPNPGLMLELDMLNVDIDRFKQDRDAWDAAVSELEACFNEIYKSLTKASKRYSGNSCNIDSLLMNKINEHLKKQLKVYFGECKIFESIINLYSNSGSEVEKYKLFRDLYDLKEIGVASYPIALALRVIDSNLPISWRTYDRYRHILYENKDTFLNPDIFKRLEDKLKSEYILALLNFFKYPEERLRIVEMYEKCPDFKKIMSVEDFLIYLTMDLSLKPFVPEEVSRITAILNLTAKIDSLNGDAPSQTLKYTISKIKKSIESNALKLIDSKVNYIERTVREGSFLENIAAKLIPDTGPLDKLIDRWKIFGAHNMSIKSFNLKESKIFDNILEKLDLLYENGDRQLAGKYASELLPKLSLWTIYSSETRVARFNKLEKFINEDDIPSYLTDWMEYIDGSIYLDRDGSLVKTLSGLEGIYRKYNDRIKRPHHYESAYSFVESIVLCLEIVKASYRKYSRQSDNV